MTAVHTETFLKSNGSRDHSLQLPYIQDPGKVDDDFASDVKLDFSVRLGTSLARESQTGARIMRNELRHGLSNVHPSKQHVSLTPRTGPSPRSGKQSVSGEVPHRVKKESRSSLVRSNTLLTVSPPVPTESALQKLKRVIRTVRIILQVCIAMKRYSKTAQTKTWSFMEMYLHMKEDLNQVVAFNPQNFARSEPESGKLKKRLSIQPCERTPQDVKAVLSLLRGNTSFQDYPTHVQIQLAWCMEYQSYEARRIILKQGHRPEAFYILLSGYVMANVEEQDKKSGKTFIKTVKEMGPGNTFGEIALIDGGRRTATIVCKTNVQLLVIMKEDFDNIIRKQLLKQINEQADFCRSLTLFKDFPCHLLVENPSHFFFQYFKKGDIVVRDSKECKYIIVVKTGRCVVVSSHTNDPERSGTTLSTHDKKDLDASFPFYDDMQKLRNFGNRHKTEEDKRKDSVCLGLLTGQLDKTRLADHGPDIQRPKTSVERERSELPPQRRFLRQKSKSLTSFFDTISEDRKDQIETDADLYTDLQDKFWSRRLKMARKKTSAEGRRFTGLRRTSSRLSNRSSRPVSSASSTSRTTVAQISEQNAGTVFIKTTVVCAQQQCLVEIFCKTVNDKAYGLESLVQKPAVTVSLVSDGAECIFISKRFLLNNANIKVLRIITDMVQTYPSSDAIEKELKHYHKWKKYKKDLVQEILQRNRH